MSDRAAEIRELSDQSLSGSREGWQSMEQLSANIEEVQRAIEAIRQAVAAFNRPRHHR